jgi:hypothetical protein
MLQLYFGEYFYYIFVDICYLFVWTIGFDILRHCLTGAVLPNRGALKANQGCLEMNIEIVNILNAYYFSLCTTAII